MKSLKAYYFCICLLLIGTVQPQSTDYEADTSAVIIEGETSPTQDSSNPETSPESKPEVEPTAAEKPSPESEPDSDAEPKAESEPEPSPEGEPDTKAEPTSESEPSTKEEPLVSSDEAGAINSEGRSVQDDIHGVGFKLDDQLETVVPSIDPTNVIDNSINEANEAIDEITKGNLPGSQHRKGDNSAAWTLEPSYNLLYSIIVIFLRKLF